MYYSSVDFTEELLFSVCDRSFLCDNKSFQSKENWSSFLIFQENSTRTKESFKIALDFHQIEAINIDVPYSSFEKGETMFQTLQTLRQYNQKSIFIIRSSAKLPKIHIDNSFIINAGDGINEHPTQSLGDFLTIFTTLNCKFTNNFLHNVNIVILGDIENSRVARSNIRLLTQFGANITLVSPSHLMSSNTRKYYETYYNCKTLYHITDDILKNSNFLIFLRTQTERNSQFIDVNLSSFALNDTNLHILGNDTFIMHPGPVNIGKELSISALNHKNSLVNAQVKNALTARKILIGYILKKY